MPATSIPPTPEQYAYLDTLTANLETGQLFKDGKEVCSKRPKDGRYILDVYNGHGKCKRFMRYNIIWYKAHGEWPTENLDHDDRNPSNDAIHNLVPKSQSGNMFNSDCGVKKTYNNPLPKGVHSYKNGRFRAYINVEGKEKHLGYFATPEKAHEIRRAAELQYYGEYSK